MLFFAVWIVSFAVRIVSFAVWIVSLVTWILCGCAVVSGCEQTGVPEAHFANHWCQPSLAAALHRVPGTA